MRTCPIILYVLLMVVTLFSCADIVEQDIALEQIHLLAPADTITDQTEIIFWWDHVPYASHYEFQMVSPDFDNINSLVADSIITVNKITLPLADGRYEWCVRAFNSAYSTNYACSDLVIQQTTIRSIPTPALEFPEQDSIITNFPLTLSWIRGDANIVGDSLYLYGADNFPVEGFPLFTRQTKFSIASLPPGIFTWTVSSIDSDSNASEITDENKWSFEVQ